MDYSLSECRISVYNRISVDVRGMVADIRAIPLPRISLVHLHSSGINAFLSVSPV